MGEQRTDATPTRPATILIVDDEPFVRELLTGFLSTLGYTVHEAGSGEEGIRMATLRRYDIVFTDIKMPGITGIEVLERVKAIDASTQVIVITGYGSIETAVECMKLGAFDYIGKPFHLDEIGILVARALEHGELQALVGLYKLSQSIFSAVRFDELLDRIIELTVQVLRADEASIMLFDERGRLYIAASTGLDDDIMRTTRIELYEPIAGRVAADGRPLILGDEINDRHRAGDRRTMISSSIVHPIVTRNKTFGILNVNRIAMPEQFTRADLEKATIFVSHIAQAIENAKLFEELERRVEELNRANEQLEYRQRQVIQAEKLSAIGNLVAGVAHELNNPLTAVMGFSEFLLMADCPDEVKQPLSKIHDAANRCRRIIQNLLSFSREQESRHRLVDLNELAADVLEFSTRGLADHGIQAVTQFETALPMVCVDPDRMKQVLLGMVHNAIAAMENWPERQLTLGTRSHRDKVSLTVSDTGVGIPEEHLTKVFDPFFTTREVGQGVGLGLSTCYAVVERFGGTVRVESQVGHGTTFTIELPVSEPRPVETEYVPLETRRPSSRGRVLVIEDEEDLCLMYEAALEQDGYEVALASSGADGIEALSRGDYDVIVLDMRMPGTDGGDVCAFIESNCPQTMKRVLFATGDTVSERTHWWIERTGQPVLNKPFRIQDLLDAVKGLERPSMPRTGRT
jgi:signal transduction histidine kinase/FixJ family two-component response regulator